MRSIQSCISLYMFCLFLSYSPYCLASRTHYHSSYHHQYGSYASRLPQTINTDERTVVVDPRVHTWGAYEDGHLIRAGLASAGSDYCRDLGRRCHTAVGTFRVFSLGSAGCYSTRFPIPYGGAPMPYCMYFNRNQALHGSPAGHVVEGNVSHGCVRMHVDDARWLRFNFVNIGTKVIIRPY